MNLVHYRVSPILIGMHNVNGELYFYNALMYKRKMSKSSSQFICRFQALRDCTKFENESIQFFGR